MVSGVVAGDDLDQVAASASRALGRPVAIAIPTLGEPVVCPAGALSEGEVRAIAAHAAAVIRGELPQPPAVLGEAVEVRLGSDVVGIVAAARRNGEAEVGSELRAWLEAAAAAGAVAAVMREAQEGGLERSRRALLQSLRAGPPADIPLFMEHARRLGFDLSSGAVAVCAQERPDASIPDLGDLSAGHRALIAEVGAGRLCGLLPLASSSAREGVEALASELAGRGMRVTVSTPHRDPASLHHALREAEVLTELDVALAGQDETYRLLIGILLRDAGQLEDLRARTIAPLNVYDAEHDTELLATLAAFLAHHGSTTDTAEAMSLHRHTVGYRLARVQEVSGLSPYESDGRERLGLGLKAHHILVADARLLHPEAGADSGTVKPAPRR
ncbi:MAG TPA: helix-turn-helix domain-containing protein [Solirubrobacteraceae bacterium]|nr:helix-turn-helix domain-containing protein [Solirubrobacteraceae bacterium]